MQWHVTERCNLKCRHCYQEAHATSELPFDDLVAVVEQFKALVARRREVCAPAELHPQINVSGGEPFVRSDFLDLLEVFAVNRKHFSFAVLTNGTLIDEDMARRLQSLHPRFVQVSLEGRPATNDGIRGQGAHVRTVDAIRHLVRAGVSTAISFTAHRYNFREFGEVARLGRELGVARVWADRLIPCGRGAALDGAVLSPEETHELFECMYAAQAEASRTFSRTEVSLGRALQFLVGGGTPYRCAAGDALVTVQPNGDLYPCRRMPIRVGNLMQTSLVELYYGSALFRSLRAHRVSKGCEGCSFGDQCRGGLKCLSYALTGDPFTADPGCWRRTEGVANSPSEYA